MANQFENAISALKRIRGAGQKDFDIVLDALLEAELHYTNSENDERNKRALNYSSFMLAQTGIYNNDISDLIVDGFIKAPDVCQFPWWMGEHRNFTDARHRLVHEDRTQIVIHPPYPSLSDTDSMIGEVYGITLRQYPIGFRHQRSFIVIFDTERDQASYEKVLAMHKGEKRVAA